MPLLVILVVQVAIVAAAALGVVYRVMGKDYEAAVITGGFCGLMLGQRRTPWRTWKRSPQRYGPAPKAFLVVPMVGAFFIDFTNAIVITIFMNLWR